MECQIWLFLLFINKHLAVVAVEVETDDGAVWHTQVAGLLALGVRIRFTAVAQLEQKTIPAFHEVTTSLYDHFVVRPVRSTCRTAVAFGNRVARTFDPVEIKATCASALPTKTVTTAAF